MFFFCPNPVSIFTDRIYCGVEDEHNTCVLVSNAYLKKVKHGRQVSSSGVLLSHHVNKTRSDYLWLHSNYFSYFILVVFILCRKIFLLVQSLRIKVTFKRGTG